MIANYSVRHHLNTTIFFGHNKYSLVILLVFCSILTNESTPLPQLSDLVRARPHVFYTIARQYDSLEFLCSKHRPALLWILPNNQQVELNQTIDSNITLEFRQSKIIVTLVRFKTLY